MGFFESAVISSNGMSVQRQVMDIISENLANVNTVETEAGGPYKRKVPIISSREEPLFANMLQQHIQRVVHISDVVEENTAPRLDYDPTHPLANEKGYVERPNINVAMEMVNMIDATRAYEANVAVFNASKSMAARALQIGA